MPSQCSAIGCSNMVNASSKERHITFHKVPSDPARRAMWKKALRRDFVITKYTVICSSHFEEQHMDRTGQTTRLRDGAVPSIFNFPDTDAQGQPQKWKRKKSKPKKVVKNSKTGAPKRKFTPKIYLPEEAVPTQDVNFHSHFRSHRKLPIAKILQYNQKARKSVRGAGRRGARAKAMETDSEPPPAAPPPAATPSPAAAPVVSAVDHHYAIDPGNVKEKLDKANVRIEELQKQLRNYRDRMRRKDAEFRVLMAETKRQNALMSELMEGSELWILCDKCGARN
ncbi:THAP domain-containing protein 1-like [Eucyclogobius newberryi]|uniref:THAP domain-containing protein 1-like n=1 Tax=Eucyclogobius newberryi TaxID=166745 RepID=UPI003B590229